MKTEKTKWIKSIAAAVVISSMGLASQAYSAEVPFLYTGDNGPGYWGELTPEWSACGAGTRQSPINLVDAKENSDLDKLELYTYPTTIHLINTGHNIEQEYEGTGSSINFAGVEYELLQFHFHTLSEHTVDDDRSGMEMHAVFSDPVSGNLLVIGTLYKIGSDDNSFIQSMIDAGLPAQKGETVTTTTSIDVKDGMTSTKSYYTYAGSLTTPPCTENVTWVVQKKQATLSLEQWQAFRDIVGNNFRPLQKINDRVISARHD